MSLENFDLDEKILVNWIWGKKRGKNVGKEPTI